MRSDLTGVARWDLSRNSFISLPTRDPKQIQELCGHRSITTTLNTYGHLFERLQDRLAERLAETFLGSRAGTVAGP
jgi:integrase